MPGRRLSVLLVERNGFLDDPAKLVEHLPLGVAAATAQDQAGRAADVALALPDHSAISAYLALSFISWSPRCPE